MTTCIHRRRLAASLLLATLPCWFTLPHAADASSDPLVTIQESAPSYTIKEVPIPSVASVPPDFLFPAINEAGQVAATGGVDGTRPQAFRTNADATSATPLGSLTTGGASMAHGIGPDGTVVGASVIDTGQVATKFLPSGQVQNLGVLPGGVISSALGINSDGTVVGSAVDEEGHTRAVQHTPGAGLTALEIGEFFDIARDINPNGMICGDSDRRTGQGYRFLNREVEDIGNLESIGMSSAYALNSAGLITGCGTLDDGLIRHAVLSKPDTSLQDLGTLADGDNSIGYDINDAGTVVGQSDLGISQRNQGPTTPQIQHAFFWTAGLGMLDLNSLVKNLGSWDLIAATGINNKGQIVGYGLLGNRLAVYRLDLATTGSGQVKLSATQVRFGMIRVGQHRRRRLILANIGNGPFSGRILQADSPFRVVSVGGRTETDTAGDFPFSLTAGRRVNVVIEFRPRKRARFRQRLMIASNDTSVPTLAVRMAGDACGRNGE